MKCITHILLVLGALVLVGCKEQGDPRIHVRKDIRSDNVVDNYVTRPVAEAFSALAGWGIDIKRAVVITNEAGYRELHVDGFNRSASVRPFRYRVEWLDANGFVIDSQATTWLRASAMSRSPFSIKAVAPTTNAVDFRMDTMKWE
ncbi:MAG TPA: DUF1425 domain-containing protein [Phycisphaerales bacterium]|nr:DUF1425 domain-containing protein [Phycisphaerales bacterium]